MHTQASRKRSKDTYAFHHCLDTLAFPLTWISCVERKRFASDIIVPERVYVWAPGQCHTLQENPWGIVRWLCLVNAICISHATSECIAKHNNWRIIKTMETMPKPLTSQHFGIPSIGLTPFIHFWAYVPWLKYLAGHPAIMELRLLPAGLRYLGLGT